MKSADEIDVLECRVRGLENEVRKLKQTLIDIYAPAALTGLLAYGYSPRDLVVEEAFRIANLCLEQRSK
mgnify:CR=1 FL=1